MSVQDDKQSKPEPDEDDKREAAKMMKAYEERPTVVLPGSNGTISGTAINDWLDDDGNPKFGKPESEANENQPETRAD